MNTIDIVFQQLGPLAAPAVPTLTAALADSDRLKRATAASLLRAIGPAALPAKDALLATLLDDEFSVAPKSAAQALVTLGPGATAEALAVARGALHDEDPKRQGEAIRALGYLGPDVARPAIPELCALAREANNPNRITCIQTLGVLGPDAAEAVPALRELIGEIVGFIAIEALGKIGAAAAPAVADLRRVLHDEKESESARAAALKALDGINKGIGGGALTMADLETAIADENHLVQMVAMQAAQQFPSLSPAFITGVLALAYRDDDWSRTMMWSNLAALLPRIEDADPPAESVSQARETQRPESTGVRAGVQAQRPQFAHRFPWIRRRDKKS
jgi:HEAT repeat protein